PRRATAKAAPATAPRTVWGGATTDPTASREPPDAAHLWQGRERVWSLLTLHQMQRAALEGEAGAGADGGYFLPRRHQRMDAAAIDINADAGRGTQIIFGRHHPGQRA